MSDDKTLHVMPENDLREHIPDTACWCHPTQDEEESKLYTHHSMDGRESYEEGRQLS